MVKVTIEKDDFTKEIKGRFVFVVVREPDSGEDTTTGLLGDDMTLAEAMEYVGISIGTQIRQVTENKRDRMELEKIVVKGVARGLSSDDVRIGDREVIIKERKDKR